jgi:hypothetical protein
MEKKDWKYISKCLLKAELAKKNIDYQQLSIKLAEIGVNESASNINSKINRGTFSFMFFMQCMQAIKTQHISIEMDNK